MKLKVIGTAILASSLALSVNAQTPTSTAKMEDMKTEMGSNEDPQGWMPFVAVGVTDTEFNDNLTGRDGVGASGRLIGSYYTQSRNWVMDAGVGFETADLGGNQTNSALIELASRARFLEKWSAGPVANFNVGGGVGTDYGSSTEDIATFVGAQVMRDFAVGVNSMIRVGAKAMTDVGIQDSIANKFLLEVQFGTASSQPTTVSETYDGFEDVADAEENEMPEPVALTTEDEEITPIAEVAEEQELIGEIGTPMSIFFETDAIEGGSNDQLKKISQILSRNRADIKKIEITGYADMRGAEDYNKKLSQKRADQVAAELQAEAGIAREALSAQGAGELPMGMVESLQDARRVDLKVIGVKNSQLESELKSLN